MKGVFSGHAGAIFGIDFDPDKGLVFTGSADKVYLTFLSFKVLFIKDINHKDLTSVS